MTTFNGAAFVLEQLRSFATQQRPPDELVVCDDGSTDDTVAIIEEFGRQSRFFVHLHQNPQRLGFTANFSRAASLCSGDLVSFSDQDDYWLPNKLSTVLAEATRHSSKQLFVNDEFIASGNLEASKATAFGNARKLGCADSDLVAGCCTTIQKPLLNVLLPFPAMMAYDKWAATMADLLGLKQLIEDPLQLYRRHGRNTTRSLLALPSPTQWTVFRHHGISDPRAAWEAEIEHLGMFETRIQSCREQIDKLAGLEAADTAIERIARQRQWVMTRRQLLDRSRFGRFPEIYRLWRTGFYQQRFGLRSAVKDAVRR
jgi:glycosyltransferase involved in cell wall biosynthesis